MWRLFRRKPKGESDYSRMRLAEFAKLAAECPPGNLLALAVAMGVEWDLLIATYRSTLAFDDAPMQEKMAYLRKRIGWQQDLNASGGPAEAIACEIMNIYLASAIANNHENRQAAMALITHLRRCGPTAT